MKYYYMNEAKLPYSEVDSTAKLNIVSTLNYMQNLSTEFFDKIGTDNFTISTKNNALWVITRTKIIFFKRPIWKEKIIMKIYPVKVSAIRFNVEVRFEDENNKVILIAKQEYCAIDIESRKARKISTIEFPEELEIQKETYIDNFKNLKDEFNPNEFVYSQKICSQDIDFCKHTNNVVYARILMNNFSCEFLENNEIKEFEIHYISESREGQVLQVYKKEISDKEIEFLIKDGEKEISRAYLTFKKI